MKNNSKSDRKRTSRNGSQRRLALIVMVLILSASAYLGLSDGGAADLRNSLLNGLGITDETSQDDASPSQGDETGSSDNDLSGQTGNASSAGGGDADSDVLNIDPEDLPEFNGTNYVTVNGSVPVFASEVYEKAGLTNESGKWKTEGGLFSSIDPDRLVSYEYYGELDKYGRCTEAYGCLSRETMPEDGEDRGDISSVHPSGWAKAQHWERCHLIAWALSAENANERNLVTGTHYMNYDGMRPLEEEVEHYIWNTGNHVLYLSRPIFKGSEKVARGVQMMAWSVEDGGRGISYNVYCFNVTPGADIDYMTGIVTTEEQAGQDARLYVVNTRTKVFHYPSCDGAKAISKRNRKEITATRVEMTSQGYTPCGYCEP